MCPSIPHRERFILLIVVLFFLLAPHPGISISNNSAIYLSEAANLSQGYSPTIHKSGLVARGPIFSYLIALIYLFTGPSVGASFLLMKGFFVLLMVCLYLTSRTFFNPIAALTAVILATCSYRIYLMGTSIDTNSLLTLFLLLFVVSILKIWRTGDIKTYFIAGFYLSIAYLIKETSLVYAPLLFISLFYLKPSLPIFYKRISYALTAIVLCLLPWVTYVYNKTSSILPVLGHFNPEFQKAFSSKIGNNISEGFYQNSLSYLYRFFSEMLPATTWLFLPITALLIWHALHLVKTRTQNSYLREDFLLLMAILLYLPIPMSDMAVSTGDPRQAYIIYFLLFILSGKWISMVWSKMSLRINGIKARILIQRAILIGTPIAIIALATFAYYPFKNPVILKIRASVYNYSPIPQIKGRYTDLQKNSALWIDKNIPPGEAIITDGYYGEPFRFFTANKHQTVISFLPKTSHEYTSTATPVFLLTYKKFRQASGSKKFLWVLNEESILQHLQKDHLVAFAHQSGFLEVYFDKAPWATLAYKNNDTFIYRINGIPFPILNNLKPIINEEFESDMEWAKTNDPEAFITLIEFLRAHRLNYPEFIKNATVLNAGEYL